MAPVEEVVWGGGERRREGEGEGPIGNKALRT